MCSNPCWLWWWQDKLFRSSIVQSSNNGTCMWYVPHLNQYFMVKPSFNCFYKHTICNFQGSELVILNIKSLSLRLSVRNTKNGYIIYFKYNRLLTNQFQFNFQARKTGGRSMSVQSSLDPYGSNLTLTSSTSSAGIFYFTTKSH